MANRVLRIAVVRTLALLFVAGCCAGQSSSVVTLSNGVSVGITSKPATSLSIEMAAASGNSFYRLFRDENHLVVFAYELAVERTSDGDHFVVTMKPTEDAFAHRFPNADAGKPVPTASQELRSSALASGQHYDIEIQMNPPIGAITDRVETRLNPGGAAANDEGVPGQTYLRFAGLRVYADSTLLSASGPSATVSGPYVMFYIPGKGGYFFSAAPVATRAFAEIGIIDRA